MTLSNVTCIKVNIIKCCQNGVKFFSSLDVFQSYTFLMLLCIAHAFVHCSCFCAFLMLLCAKTDSCSKSIGYEVFLMYELTLM